MTSPRGPLCRRQQWALLTSALTKSTLTIDRSTGSVGSGSQWSPSVSLTSDAYKWGPRVRLKPKGKGKRLQGLTGRKQADGPSRLGSHEWAARPAACRPARVDGSQAGSACGSQAGSVRLRTEGPAWVLGSAGWADRAQAAHRHFSPSSSLHGRFLGRRGTGGPLLLPFLLLFTDESGPHGSASFSSPCFSCLLRRTWQGRGVKDGDCAVAR